ncbi:ATP-binding protein [Vulgatibacter sp.]|uniref:sensor histidine kinase n=1 Tax=Vulgatibacter sp. TaxID=1971226 RepID=UPI0035675196
MQLGHRILLLGATAVLLVGGMGAGALVGAARGEAVRASTFGDREQLQAVFRMAIDALELRRAGTLGDPALAGAIEARIRGELATYRSLVREEPSPLEAREEERLAAEIDTVLTELRAQPLASIRAEVLSDTLVARIRKALEREQAELAASAQQAHDVIGAVRLLGIAVPALALVLIVWISLTLLVPLRDRVRDLLAGAERIRRGDTRTEIPERGGDELAQVAAAWNAMQRELRLTTVSRSELEENLAALREARAQLVVADRMALVGTLAAGVAHEINNPLSYLGANLEWIRAELALRAGDRSDLARALEEATDGAQRIAAIVGDLRAFSREDETRVQVDLRQVVEDAIRLGGHEVRQVATLERQLDEVPPVLGNRMRLGQVVLNLLVNAAQSFPPERAGNARIAIRTRTDADGNAVVEVEDDGPGVPEEIRHRIFDPFFTTKPVGVGTGLGLSVCNGIVAAHGGAIEYVAAAGGGSLFRVTLGGVPTARVA